MMWCWDILFEYFLTHIKGDPGICFPSRLAVNSWLSLLGLNLSSIVIISVQSARSLPVCAPSRQVDPESQGRSRQPRLKKVKLLKLL